MTAPPFTGTIDFVLSIRAFDERTARKARVIPQSLGIGRTTVGEYLRRAAVGGMTWPVELDDAELERLLFTPAGFYEGPTRPQPDWSRLHTELRRRGVTLMLLWEEYRAEHPDGYGYSRFCDLYLRGSWRDPSASRCGNSSVGNMPASG